MSHKDPQIFSDVRENFYRDSVNLMQLSTLLRELDGIIDVAVVMGTENNKNLLTDAGLMTPEIKDADSSDMCIVAVVQHEELIETIKEKIDQYFEHGRQTKTGDQLKKLGSLEAAIRNQPGTNLALISVPGSYAANLADKCLKQDLNVFLFSDNVSVEDEIRLKNAARKKGLLMMGPDCGTALINNVPLGFANNIRRGNIGIVSASGTGLQEVSTLIHKKGMGISQAIGTGGRDLSGKVGGKTMLHGIELLLQDTKTDVLVLISKPPDPEVSKRVLTTATKEIKPVVVCFLGWNEEAISDFNGYLTSTLDEAAEAAVRLSSGDSLQGIKKPKLPELFQEKVLAETESLQSGRKYVRGLYTGGTLADEAALLISEKVGEVWAVDGFGSVSCLPDVHVSRENSVVDLGADVFTEGRAHPMIDPRIRKQRLLNEVEDDEVAVFLFDVVLGWGSHEDPGGELSDAVEQARLKIQSQDQPLFIASVTGTELDPQDYEEQVRKLESAGVMIAESNVQAALAAALVIEEVQT